MAASTFELMQQANYLGLAGVVVVFLLYYNRVLKAMPATVVAAIVIGVAYYNNLTKAEVAAAAKKS